MQSQLFVLSHNSFSAHSHRKFGRCEVQEGAHWGFVVVCVCVCVRVNVLEDDSRLFHFYFCCFDSFAHSVLSVAMVTACHYYADSDTEG